MLKGLEVKEILFSELGMDNEKFRIDDEFYQKKHIESYKKIKLKPYDYFSDLIEKLTDYHANGAYESLKINTKMLDIPDYAYMVRSTDLESKNFSDNVKYVSQYSYGFYRKQSCMVGKY